MKSGTLWEGGTSAIPALERACLHIRLYRSGDGGPHPGMTRPDSSSLVDSIPIDISPTDPEPQSTAPEPAGNGAGVSAVPRVSTRELEARIRRYNSDLDPRSDTFRAAVILLASSRLGHNIDLLSRRTGYDRAFVARVARRLSDNGVWKAGRTLVDWSSDDEASGTFWNDVAVAEGKMCRRVETGGRIEWAPAGFWNKNFESTGQDGADRLATLYIDRDGATDATAGSAPAPGSGPVAANGHPGPAPDGLETGPNGSRAGLVRNGLQSGFGPPPRPVADSVASRPDQTGSPSGVDRVVPAASRTDWALDPVGKSSHGSGPVELPTIDEFFGDVAWIG